MGREDTVANQVAWLAELGFDEAECFPIVSLCSFRSLEANRVNFATPNKITGPNAGGPRQLLIRTSLAASVGQFVGAANCDPEGNGPGHLEIDNQP